MNRLLRANSTLPGLPGDLAPPETSAKLSDQAFTAKGLPTKPVNLCLRNIATEETHRLREIIFVGRSASKMRKGIDLLIDCPDISRIHCSIQVNENGIYIFNESDQAVDVDGIPVKNGDSRQIKVGTFLRFGQRNMWVVERSSLFQPSKERTEQDPLDLGEWMEVTLSAKGQVDTLRRCDSWFAFVDTLVELNPSCPLSAKTVPCVDAICILDSTETLGAFGPLSYDDMVAFPMVKIIECLLGVGQKIRAHFSADPLILAMVAKNLKERGGT